MRFTPRCLPRVNKVVYLGSAPGAAWLDKIGVSYQQVDVLSEGVGLLLIGPDAKIDSAALRAYAEQGGKILFLPYSQAPPEPTRRSNNADMDRPTPPWVPVPSHC